jgi:4-amino-4-deoxy-L-arabinose transferase-like glycosyltransferase
MSGEAIAEETASLAKRARRGRRLLAYGAIWRSPPGQPRWARPTLLLVSALAALGYAWGAGHATLEPFYGAAARSMSQSWHDFLFGAFDPLGTISVDKLPGALWIQALSLRIFGFHIWAVVLPQIVEGVLSILVLYRAVQRLAGPIAAISAAIVLAGTPVTMELNRGNVSDSLLVLLTVLAADAASAAVLDGRMRRLLLAAFWLGLAFQAKMLQAWFVAPALALPYLMFGPGVRSARIKQLGLAGLLMVVVSISWMSAVSLVPASERPYVDGSRNDSLFSQVFVYNGYARLGRSEALATFGNPVFFNELSRSHDVLNASTESIRPSWHRILSGPLGRDVGWLLPAAALGAVLLVWDRRRAGPRDPRVLCLLMWLGWLLILGVSFSTGVYLNSYYLAALSPAIAAICGLGADLYWRRRTERNANVALAVAITITAGYGMAVLSGASHVPGWIVPICLASGAVGIAGLALTALHRSRRVAGRLGVAALASLLAFSAAASASVVSREQDPFSTPYGQHATVHPGKSLLSTEAEDVHFMNLLRAIYKTQIALSTYTSAFAAEYVLYSGMEALPIGGYSGLAPSPSVGSIAHMVAAGRVRLFQIPVEPKIDDPRLTWIETHCALLRTFKPLAHDVQFGVFYCSKGAASITLPPTG